MPKRSFAVLIAAVMLMGCAAKYEYAEQAAFDNAVYNRESAGIRLEDDFYGYCNFDFLYTNKKPSDMPEYSYGQLVGTHRDETLSEEILSIAVRAAAILAEASTAQTSRQVTPRTSQQAKQRLCSRWRSRRCH